MHFSVLSNWEMFAAHPFFSFFFFAFLLLLQVNALRLKTYWSRSIVNVWMYISAKTITWLKAHRHSMTFLTTKGTVEQKWICFCFFVLFASHVPPACKQRCTFTWKSRELSDTHISANYRTLNFKYIYIYITFKNYIGMEICLYFNTW